MHKDAIEHLRSTDPALAKIIDRVGEYTFVPRNEGSHFDALVRAIVYQQLSGKAAATIHRRFEEIYGGRPPTPQEVVATDEERMRAVGLSRQKLTYIKDLASKVASGELPTDSLDSLPDDQIIESLVRVKGIGRWSAQMFLMFRLGRPNVLPDLDLGVQKGVQHTYGLETLPKPKDVLRIGERWAPYASVASWYMWRMLELPDVIRAGAENRSSARKASAPAKKAAGAKKRPATWTKKAGTARAAARKRAAAKSTAKRAAKPKRKGSAGPHATARRATSKRSAARTPATAKRGARKKSGRKSR
jgi:endonuclease III